MANTALTIVLEPDDLFRIMRDVLDVVSDSLDVIPDWHKDERHEIAQRIEHLGEQLAHQIQASVKARSSHAFIARN